MTLPLGTLLNRRRPPILRQLEMKTTTRFLWARRAVACSLLALLIPACQSATEKRAQFEQTKIIKIGIDATFPPFEFIDSTSGTVEGLDVDLAKSIWSSLDYKIEFVVVPFDGIVSGLESGAYDVIISAFTITPERSERVLFSDPYYDVGQILAVPAADTTVVTFSDLAGRRVGVQRSSTSEALAKLETEVEVYSYDRIEDAFIAMASGQLEAVLNDRPTSELYIATHSDAKLTGPMLSGEQYAAAFRKSDGWLRDLFDSSLALCVASGELEALRDKHIPPLSVPDTTRTLAPTP